MHVESQLTEERATKASLEARGTGLITSSSAFVTLLAAGFTLAYGKDPGSSPTVSRWLVMGSVGTLLIAAVAGVFALKPLDYGETSIETMQ